MDVCGSTGVNLPRTWGELVSPAARVRIIIVTVLLLLVYWGTVRHTLVARWLSDGNWSHGWLIPVFSLYFLGKQREAFFRCRFQPGYVGAVILAMSLAVYFVSAWRLGMSYPQGLSIVGAVFGITLLMGGWDVMRVAWFPILFLLFAIPLPRDMFVALTTPLQTLASTVSAAVMPMLVPGLHTQAQAVVIDYVMPGKPPGTLNVAEACSGMRSTMAFVTLGVAIAYLGDRPVWQRIVMVLMCVPIAVFCNTIRVTVTGVLYVNGYVDLAKGTAHQVLGILMFAIALGLFALIGYVLSRLFIEVPEAADEGGSVR